MEGTPLLREGENSHHVADRRPPTPASTLVDDSPRPPPLTPSSLRPSLAPPFIDGRDVEAALRPSTSTPTTTITTTTNDAAASPYHVFSKRRRWRLVCLVSVAGAFSPLTSNIYFPAVDAIAADLGVSASLVALTITVYMVVQGIVPPFFGALSDVFGRRPALALALATYAAANLALAFTPSYPALLALRALQALGSSATISISAGVIGDVASPCERGGFMGVNAGIRMVGQAIGPILGGALNGAWGFRSIFWLLFASSFLVLLALLIFLPETQRAIAGDGSIPLAGIHRPWAYLLLRPPKEWAPAAGPAAPPRRVAERQLLSLSKVVAPLGYLAEKDILTLLSWGALVFAAWSTMTSSTTTVLLRKFPDLEQWQVGLCFLPNGLGCVVGSLVTGRLLDMKFRRVEAQYKEGRESKSNKRCEDGKEEGEDKDDGNQDDRRKEEEDVGENFPLERARLPLMPYLSVAFVVAVALYGPSYELSVRPGTGLVAPLLLQFVMAFGSTAVFNINSTLLVDCFPESSAGTSAANNLCRCLLGAAGVSAIQPLIDAVEVRGAFLILAGVLVVFSPLVWVQWRWGESWRLEREKARRQRRGTVRRC